MSYSSHSPKPQLDRRRWTRTTSLERGAGVDATERWEYRDGEERVLSVCEVVVKIGKPLDVVGLKGTDLKELREYAEYLRQSAASLYGTSVARHELLICPCCNEDNESFSHASTVYAVEYWRCDRCGHVFVRSQPNAEALEAWFERAELHSAPYTDKARTELRLSQVVTPKLNWIIDRFYAVFGAPPQSLIDVGAGGGHFVEVARRRGLAAEGYEISAPSCRFAKSNFGIDLRNADFLLDGSENATTDVVTLWGLLEYTPEPRRFLEASRRRMKDGRGMLIVEVPRYDSLGTAMQQVCPDTIARHLDPTSHVNCFSDASIVTALHDTGFRPVAAWYFGMDAYELLAQMALQLESETAFHRLAHWIPPLQKCFDTAECCDNLIVAAVPVITG